MNNCKNCNEPIHGNYCSNCGCPAKLKRIDRNYIFQEAGEILCANKGFLFTIKSLLLKPGESVRLYITEDRYRFVKPITFLIITSLVYAFVNHFFSIDILPQYYDPTATPTINKIIIWMGDNPGYTSIITGLYLAFWIKIFFKKYGFNLYEIFVLLCFVSGFSSLITSAATILQSIIPLSIDLITISIVISLFYTFWAVGQFFDRKKAASYIKAAVAYIVGMLVLMFIGAVGAVIEIFIMQ
ncbi:MAG: DUF3667 domain-containing protein [Lentimicrobiaceae bacterium]|nr:DUF3667 domain-containing protein [Lentimicrobiaceae bacterium]